MIKLGTFDRREYHIENIKIMWHYKLFVSTIVSGIINFIVGFMIKRFTKKQKNVEMDPYSMGFFPALMEKYRECIIVPYKNGTDLFETLKQSFCFESLDYEETMKELQGFLYGKRIEKEQSETYLLKRDKASEIYYRHHIARFFPVNRIVLLIDHEHDEFITNDGFFQKKIDILRGINSEEVDNFTRELKTYLNILYLYDIDVERDKDTN